MKALWQNLRQDLWQKEGYVETYKVDYSNIQQYVDEDLT